MNVRAQLLFLMTTYIAVDNMFVVGGVCSSSRVYTRNPCPALQTAVGGTAELDARGQLEVRVSLSWQARPYGPAWRLRVQRENDAGAPAVLALARRCAEPADDDDDDYCLRAALPLLAARPAQRLWVWVEKLGRQDELGCSYCDAKPIQVVVLQQKELWEVTSGRSPSPPSTKAAVHHFVIDLGAVAAVGVAAGLIIAFAALIYAVKGRHVTMFRWLRRSAPPEEPHSKDFGRQITERPLQVPDRQVPRRLITEPPPPPPMAPSAPPATPPLPPPSSRGPLFVLHPPPESPRFQPPPTRPLPPLPPRGKC